MQALRATSYVKFQQCASQFGSVMPESSLVLSDHMTLVSVECHDLLAFGEQCNGQMLQVCSKLGSNVLNSVRTLSVNVLFKLGIMLPTMFSTSLCLGEVLKYRT